MTNVNLTGAQQGKELDQIQRDRKVHTKDSKHRKITDKQNLAKRTDSDARGNGISYTNTHHMQYVDDCQLGGWSFAEQAQQCAISETVIPTCK